MFLTARAVRPSEFQSWHTYIYTYILCGLLCYMSAVSGQCFSIHLHIPWGNWFYHYLTLRQFAEPTAARVVRKIAGNSDRSVLWGCARDRDKVTPSLYCRGTTCRHALRDVSGDGEVILKWMLKHGLQMLTGLVWFRIGSSDRLLWTRWWTFRFCKIQRLFYLPLMRVLVFIIIFFFFSLSCW